METPGTPRPTQSGTNHHFVPSILLSNVMSLVPKIDELALVVGNHNLDIICISETWLKNQIPDDAVQIHNYTLLRRDRKEREHGGVCLYIKNSYSISVLDVPNEHECEVLWAVINSRRLQRGYAKLVIGVLYHSLGANKSLMLEHLQSSLEIMETKYPNCGILLTGDFNKLPTQQLTRHFHLKQIVDFSTRGSSKLDLILTLILPTSTTNHIVYQFPNIRTKETRSKKVIYVRDKRPSTIRLKVPWDFIWYPPTDHVKKT